ncbi:MAG: hypothetical protein ACLR8Y_09010 [Alistipes indistinctus]
MSTPDMAAVNVQNRALAAQGFLPAEVTQVGVIAEKRQTSMLLIFSLYSSDNSVRPAVPRKLCEHQRRARG